jgi:membrane fusion protein (multidrug efflux system)
VIVEGLQKVRPGAPAQAVEKAAQPAAPAPAPAVTNGKAAPATGDAAKAPARAN